MVPFLRSSEGVPTPNLVDFVGTLASLGSNEKCADEIMKNRGQLYDALDLSKKHSLVMSCYEDKYMKTDLSNSAIGTKDIKEQVINDCKYSVDLWNKKNTDSKIEFFIVDGEQYVLTDNGQWFKQTYASVSDNEKIGLFSVTHQAGEHYIALALSMIQICQGSKATIIVHAPLDSKIISKLKKNGAKDDWKILPEQKEEPGQKNTISSHGWFSTRNVLCCVGVIILFITLYCHKQKFIHA